MCKDKSKHCSNHFENQFSDSEILLYEHNNTEEIKEQIFLTQTEIAKEWNHHDFISSVGNIML